MFQRSGSMILTLFMMLALALPATRAALADEPAMTEAQKAAFEKLVHDYIMKNPTVILESVRAHQEAEAEAEKVAQKQRLAEMHSKIMNEKMSPVGGNPAGDVTIVEFFDYRCGYCKSVHDTVMDTVKNDGKVRLVYKEFPILGPDSVVAAHAALGVFFTMKDKYFAFSDALMRAKGGLNEDRVMQIAESIGLDPKAVKKSMSDPRIEKELSQNMALAASLNIRGTPAFIVNKTLVPGAVDKETLLDLIKEARKG
jgi:protein-disulfide isomerase